MAASKQVLGRGLQALLGEDTAGNQTSYMVKLAHIDPNREQPRKHFDDEALAELADNITRNGIIVPLTLRRTDNDRY